MYVDALRDCLELLLTPSLLHGKLGQQDWLVGQVWIRKNKIKKIKKIPVTARQFKVCVAGKTHVTKRMRGHDSESLRNVGKVDFMSEDVEKVLYKNN